MKGTYYMTTATPIPTPYDAEIDSLPTYLTPMQMDRLHVLMGSQTGYRSAKAEDAPLLEAARLVLDFMARWDIQQRVAAELALDVTWVSALSLELQTAIAEAEGRTP